MYCFWFLEIEKQIPEKKLDHFGPDRPVWLSPHGLLRRRPSWRWRSGRGGGAPSRARWRPSRPCRERGRRAQAATWAWAAVLAHAGAPFPSLDLSRRIWSDDPASCAQAIKDGDFGEAANPNFFSILLPSRHSHPAARKHRRLADGEPPFSLLCLLFSFYQLRRTSAAKELWFLADRALLLPLCFFFFAALVRPQGGSWLTATWLSWPSGSLADRVISLCSSFSCMFSISGFLVRLLRTCAPGSSPSLDPSMCWMHVRNVIFCNMGSSLRGFLCVDLGLHTFSVIFFFVR